MTKPMSDKRLAEIKAQYDPKFDIPRLGLRPYEQAIRDLLTEVERVRAREAEMAEAWALWARASSAAPAAKEKP